MMTARTDQNLEVALKARGKVPPEIATNFAPDEQGLLEGDRVLRSLVARSPAFLGSTTIEEAQSTMQRTRCKYAAVIEGQQVVGLLSMVTVLKEAMAARLQNESDRLFESRVA